MMKNYTSTEIQLERFVKQIFNTPMPQILQEIVEFEEIVGIPVSQIEFVFLKCSNTCLCFGMERCAFFVIHFN